MIFVERPANDVVIAALASRGRRSGLSEYEAALWFYEDKQPELEPLPAKPAKAPEFTAYRGKPVKKALAELFGRTCAYCESIYAHLLPMDVEHYRPKGGYLDPDGTLCKPGYYWLAADWNNLLPSCIDCNRAREQVPGTGKAKAKKLGKANQFPIVAGTARATNSDGEAAERPLLLNPCKDDPSRHLAFYSDGHVLPAATAEEVTEPKGVATINVCGLHRAELIMMRREHAASLRAAFRAVLVADRSVTRHPGDPVELHELGLAEAQLEDVCTSMIAYRALTRSLRLTFDALRPLVQAHLEAKAAFVANPQDDIHTQVFASAESIRAFCTANERDLPFLAELLAQIHITINTAE